MCSLPVVAQRQCNKAMVHLSVTRLSLTRMAADFSRRHKYELVTYSNLPAIIAEYYIMRCS